MASLYIKAEEDDLTYPEKPWLSYEVIFDMDKFSFLETQEIKDGTCVPLRFDKKYFEIQSPRLLTVGILKDYNDKNGDNKIKKYSFNIRLDDSDSEKKEFYQAITQIDAMAMEQKRSEKDVFVPSAKVSNRGHQFPILRIKVPVKARKLDIVIVDNGKKYYEPTPETFLDIIGNRSFVKCVLHVPNIWYAGGKYGVSYQLKKIMTFERKAREVKFRDE